MIRTRFAPSPTGHLHLGNARTALFAWLLARSDPDGHIILRIEDTDPKRSKPEFEKSIIEDLRWLGIAPDEGPEEGGEFGPYRQSERAARHAEAVDILIREGKAYPCFCSPQQLEADRANALRMRKPPRYSGWCRTLSQAQIDDRRLRGMPESVRFRMPETDPAVSDLLRGPIPFHTRDLDDFIIRRADGSVSFLLASALDDADQHVTHVLRGDDHISNTPRQVLLLRALGLHAPQYAHLGLVMGRDGQPLSKRQGSVSVRELRQRGFFPEAAVAALARLGWNAPEDFTGDPLLRFIELFRIESLSPAPCVWDEARLMHENAVVMRQSRPQRILDLAATHYPDLAIHDERFLRAFEAVRPELKHIDDVPRLVAPLLPGDVKPDKEAAKVLEDPQAKAVVYAAADEFGKSWPQDKDTLKQALLQVALRTGSKGRELYMPLRAALTGRIHGVEMIEVLRLLGREESLRRLRRPF